MTQPLILVIDDSEPERGMIRLMLEAEGYAVREAAGGDEGLDLFTALRPALVLCDLMMPGRSGFDIVHAIRARAPEARVVAVSGTLFGVADHEIMKKRLGVVAVVEKPFRQVQLLEAVRVALAGR